jgi:ankyrin repeat protein
MLMDSVFGEKEEKLLRAANEGDLAAAVDVVEGGADVNAIDPQGFSPLMVAAFRRDRDMAEFLIGMGADVNRPNVRGVVPLHYAAYAGDVTLCELLFINGADVDAPIYEGLSWGPLHCASYAGNVESFEFLLGAGANPQIVDGEGFMAHEVAHGTPAAQLIEAKVRPMLPAPDRDAQAVQ